MVDERIVLERLAALGRHCSRARASLGDLEGFVVDEVRQDLAAFHFLQASQVAQDLATHLIADRGLAVPATVREQYLVLAREGLLPAQLATELARVAQVRNRIAHAYTSLDPRRFWAEAPAGLAHLEQFASLVAKLL